MSVAYAELQTSSCFSFLRGASHAEELVERARQFGLAAIGICDRNTLAGVVRAHIAAKAAGLRLLVGVRLDVEDGPDLLCYPTDRAAYGRLSRLISIGRTRPGMPGNECRIEFEDVRAAGDGQILIVLAPDGLPDTRFVRDLDGLARVFPRQLYLAASHRYCGFDRARIAALDMLARQVGIPLVATGDVLYHDRSRRPLRDVMTCIRKGIQVRDAGFALDPNDAHDLKSPAAMARLFAGFEPALARTIEIVDRCDFNLDSLRYEYPSEPVPPGATAQSHLRDLTWRGAAKRWPDGIPAKVKALLGKELALICELEFAHYFLTVHDIVAWARGQGILCQGRGSAANSAVCFCLGITAVDPDRANVLFERFISRERREPPDIDVDFEHERREEVIQYVYRRYGRERAAIAATVIHYRPRSAIRDVCKALGLSEDVPAALAGTVWGSRGKRPGTQHVRDAGLDPDNRTIRAACVLSRQLVGFPRHLSQHVGGFVLTEGALVETVPVRNAAMPERTFIEWDKDDIDALGLMKVDVLGLGMLTCIRKSLALIAAHKGIHHQLADIPSEDAGVYDMICRADTIGVFQIESRAQMSMLPRLRPRRFYDLVIEVAIVRPGPIQGNMVHPYLRRRAGKETVSYPSPDPEHGPANELKEILKRTLGVPLFQEQAMSIALEAARLSVEEVNGLRRAMATFRRTGTIGLFERKMVEGMVHRGYRREFAKRCFEQIKGFGEYGFPESHAASFALLVYVSSWIKHHHPDAFLAALLNSQPLGFYAPAQLVADARKHGVEVRAADINHSRWDCTLEPNDGGLCAVRLGFRVVDGLRHDEIEMLLLERERRAYTDVADLRHRSGVARKTLEILADSDGFRSLGLERREALWTIRGTGPSRSPPLFARHPEHAPEPLVTLPPMPLPEHVMEDYRLTRLSLKAHPLRFLRRDYARAGLLSCGEAVVLAEGSVAAVCGLVLIRQKPGTANGVVFLTLEDETGIVNAIVWPDKVRRFRPIVMRSTLLLARGRIQRADGVVHLIVDTLSDKSRDLNRLTGDSRSPAGDVPPAPSVGHPRRLRVVPRSRDFH